MTYADINWAANKIANGLKSLGIHPGDKVAMMLPNVPQFPVVYYGVLKLGATVVPLNASLQRSEIEHHLKDADAVALFAWEDIAEEAAHACRAAGTCQHLIIVNKPGSVALPEKAISYDAILAVASSSFDMIWTMPDDTAAILYTTGPAGEPRGAELTHFNLFYNAVFCADHLLGMTPSTVSLAAFPLSHAFGQTVVMNATFYTGGTITLLSPFDPQNALRTIQRDRVTFFAGTPPMYREIVSALGTIEYDLQSLQLCMSSGAALPQDVRQAFEERVRTLILEGYGLTETSPMASCTPRDGPRKPGSIGLPIWGTEMRVVDESDKPMPVGDPGEITIRGHNVMKGYYRHPEETAAVMRHGWLHTGDIGWMDEDGYFYVVGRKTDLAAGVRRG